VIEAAYVDVTAMGFIIKPGWSFLVKPSLPINVEARAAHHISDKDAAKGISWEEASGKLADGTDFFVSHNTDFERVFSIGTVCDGSTHIAAHFGYGLRRRGTLIRCCGITWQAATPEKQGCPRTGPFLTVV
jgi:hypothetical protein